MRDHRAAAAAAASAPQGQARGRGRGPLFQTQSPHQPLTTAELDQGVRIDDKTTARLTYTYPLSRDYGLPVAVEGWLDDASTRSLVQLYNQYAPKEARLKSRGGSATATATMGASSGVDGVADMLQNIRMGTGLETTAPPGGAVCLDEVNGTDLRGFVNVFRVGVWTGPFNAALLGSYEEHSGAEDDAGCGWSRRGRKSVVEQRSKENVVL